MNQKMLQTFANSFIFIENSFIFNFVIFQRKKSCFHESRCTDGLHKNKDFPFQNCNFNTKITCSSFSVSRWLHIYSKWNEKWSLFMKNQVSSKMFHSIWSDVFFWKTDDFHEKHRFWMNVGRREAANLGTCTLWKIRATSVDLWKSIGSGYTKYCTTKN